MESHPFFHFLLHLKLIFLLDTYLLFSLMQFLNLSLLFIFHFSFLTTTGHVGVLASSHHHDHHHHHHRHHHVNEHELQQRTNKIYSKLFVFGDSYADTGNNRKSIAESWKEPYGITFPGKPAGRFSDGRVLTDYIAKYLGLKSPVPYRWMKYAGIKRLRHGMNFAYGGTGVFDTLVLDPNMTTQIDFFQKLITDSVYTITDLQSSFVLLTLSGNDYGAYLAKGGTAEDLPNFITRVVNQLGVNLKRIHGLGAKKIAVAALQPLGCLPRTTILNSFQQCNATENTAVSFHNMLLKEAMAKLNNETKDSAFVVLDLYSSFNTVLERKGDQPGSLKFQTPLKPCCMGISHAYSCGNVNEKGEKMYTVCSDPESAFFWDAVHPTQAGWHAIFTVLQPTLQEIY